MRFTFIVIFSILITVSVGSVVKEFQKNKNHDLVSPLVAGVSTSSSNMGFEKDDRYYSGWQTFINNYFHYKIKHPTDVEVKNSRNGNITLLKDNSFNILITQRGLTSIDTINTIIENDIDNKKLQLKNNFSLERNITPVAIGAVTAQSYAAKEFGQKLFYYYVPLEPNKYLLITCRTDSFDSDDFLTAEKIIYSLESLP